MAKKGRPSDYDKSYCKQAERLCLLGATDGELADFFEVDVRTIYRWKAVHEDFSQALKAGKQAADDRVERSLYQRAVGYSYDTVKIFNNLTGPTIVPYRELVPPDPTSCIFWLKNRRKDEWRDKQEHALTGPGGGPIQTEEVGDKDMARRIAFIFRRAEVASSGE